MRIVMQNINHGYSSLSSDLRSMLNKRTSNLAQVYFSYKQYLWPRAVPLAQRHIFSVTSATSGQGLTELSSAHVHAQSLSSHE